MILCIRKIHLRLAAFLLCFFCGMMAILWYGHLPAQPVFAPGEGAPITVVLDPGHGGEDGGAVSSDGVAESQINLDVALRVEDLLRFSGWQTKMTRREDVSIHSEGASSTREKKASDLKNRVNLVNGTQNAILLSIHQNSLPSSVVTHGAQAFFNEQEGADTLAKLIQDSLNHAINKERPKQAKAMDPSIYLMKKAMAPGILVECGFLSNQAETILLQDAVHQRKLAAAIAAGFLRGMAGEEVS